MHDFAASNLKPGQIFRKDEAVRWFETKYPKINPATVRMHVEGMSVNSRLRKHHSNIRPGTGHDLFYKMGPDQFRLWSKESDAPPLYRDDFLSGSAPAESEPLIGQSDDEAESNEQKDGKEFALESDLKNYLVRNLQRIEPGLRLYEDEGLTGVEFPVGGRYIDILAKDSNDEFVVIELKVSRGYDRTIGQLLRYMGWIEANLAQGKIVRGIIVASHITEDLKLAAARVPGVKLVEYELSFSLRPVS